MPDYPQAFMTSFRASDDLGASARPSGQVRRLHPFQWFILILCVLPLLTAVIAGQMIWQHGGHEHYFGWETLWARTVVSSVDAGGPAEGKLHPGDLVVAQDGDARVVMLGTFRMRRDVQPGRPYTIDFVRDGEPHRVVLQSRLVERGRQPALVGQVIVGLIWTAFSLYIGLRRPSLSTARLVALAGMSMGLNIMRTSMFPLLAQMDSPFAAFYGWLLLNTGLALALAYHAAYRFPPGAPSGRFWTGALVVVYAMAAVHVLSSFLTGVRYWASPGVAVRLLEMSGPLAAYRGVIDTIILSLTAGLAASVMFRNYRTVPDPGQKRRIRWVVVATLFSALLAVPVALQGPGVSTREVATDLFSVVIPIAFSYAIVRHRILDIAVVVRIGLQYLLARNALRIAVAGPLLALLYVVLTNPDATMKEILIGQPMYVSLAVMSAGALITRKRLMVAIDRRFFREAYDRERLLQAILEDVDGLYTNEQGLNRISERLDAALHPTAVSFWFFQDDREHLRLSHARSSSGIVAGETCSLSLSVIQQLGHADRALYVSGLTSGDDYGDVRDLCKRLRVELLVPMLGRDGRLRGAMMLGAKRSDEAYTPAELMLLQRIARQIGTVKEHVELRSRIEEEQRVRSEVLGHLASRDINLLKECPQCGSCYDSCQSVCDLDGRELTMTLPVERTVESRYRLDRLIGRGGMGAVYAAIDLRLRREVAVKIMLGRNFGNQDALKRFDREARAIARLSHPNIVAVFDYGTLAGQGAFLVMERVEGVTLRTELNRQPRFPPRECQSWIAEILEGVAAAHGHGIIHRDLKPENVLLASGSSETASRVKLLDFGLARFASSSTEDTMSISAPGLALGTIAYMAPEQMLGKAVDERADIFSLGVMLLEILSGRRLFSEHLMHRLFESQKGIPSAMIEDPRVRVALERSVAADASDRYATVDEFRRGLLPAMASWLATLRDAGQWMRDAPPHPTGGEPTC